LWNGIIILIIATLADAGTGEEDPEDSLYVSISAEQHHHATHQQPDLHVLTYNFKQTNHLPSTGLP